MTFFDDDDDDKKDFPNDISVKIEEDFPDDNNDDVVIKQENDTEMDNAETIPNVSPKGKIILTIEKQLSMRPREGKVKIRLMKKYLRSLS